MNGPRISYRVDGERGPWVTLVTGIANDTTMWNAQVPALGAVLPRAALRPARAGRQRRHRAALQHRAAGPTIWSGSGDRLGVEKTHLIGLGLGGGIVQAAAVAHRDRLISLMPVCCRAKMVPEFAAMWRALIEKVKKDGVESIVEQTAQRWFSDDFKAKNPGVLDEVRAMIRRTSLDGYLGCVGAFLGMDVEKDSGRIRVPTHYLSGAEDKVGGPPALMAGTRGARFPARGHASVPGAAHIANVQNPAGFNELVVALPAREPFVMDSKTGITGSQAMLRGLRSMGVERIFASPGSDWAPLWEALAARRVLAKCRDYISSRHEETAVGMALGYAKATGKLPAVMVHTTVGALHATMVAARRAARAHPDGGARRRVDRLRRAAVAEGRAPVAAPAHRSRRAGASWSSRA